MNVCFCYVNLIFFTTSQEIGWEERLRNDLICVEFMGRKTLTRSQSPVSCCLSILHECEREKLDLGRRQRRGDID